MSERVYKGFVLPQRASIVRTFDQVRYDARIEIESLLASEVFTESDSNIRVLGKLARLLGARPTKAAQPTKTENALRLAYQWKDERNEDVPSASRRALGRVLGSIVATRGALLVDRDVISKIAEGMVLNRLGSAAVGKRVEELFEQAVRAERYRKLPRQSAPVFLNTKGASASGKSTIRPRQRRMAESLGLD